MALAQVAGLDALGFVDKRRTQGATSGSVGTPANYADVGALRSRLNTINSTLYSAANLDKMTANDMVYAVRLNDDAAGI